MTTREFMGQAFYLNKEIKSKESQIQLLRDQVTRVSAVLSGDKVQISPRPDRMGDLAARIADLVTEYRRDVKHLLELKRDIQAEINKVSRSNYRTILTERYINFKRWEDIAADNNCSWRSVHRQHAAALRELTAVKK